MQSIHCGTSWFPLPDGWWGACCSAHDAAGITLDSNLAFAGCLLETAGPDVAFIGGILVTLAWLIKQMGLWPGDKPPPDTHTLTATTTTRRKRRVFLWKEG